MSIQEAVKRTERAAWDYHRASKDALRNQCWIEFDKNAAPLRAAQSEQIGRVTVTAGIGGNSRRPHARHTFKIDGKRASFSEVLALLVTDKA